MAFAAVLDTLSCIQRSFAARCSGWPNTVGADPQLVPLCRQPLVGEVGPEGEVADLVDAALAPCGEPVDEHVGVTTAGAGRMPAAAFLAGDGSTWKRPAWLRWPVAESSRRCGEEPRSHVVTARFLAGDRRPPSLTWSPRSLERP